MPRRKVIPEEEQVNEMEKMLQEESAEGLDQPVSDVPQEDTLPPAASDESPTPEDTGLPQTELPDSTPPEAPVDTAEESSARTPFWMEPNSPPPPPVT